MIMLITTTDDKEFQPSDAKCVGSVATLRSCDINKPPAVGQYPVFVEQSGSYRIFTYSRKIKTIGENEK